MKWKGKISDPDITFQVEYKTFKIYHFVIYSKFHWQILIQHDILETPTKLS